LIRERTHMLRSISVAAVVTALLLAHGLHAAVLSFD
jgi:hypothetical protein